MHGHFDRGRFRRRASALCHLLDHFQPFYPGKIGPFCFLFVPFSFSVSRRFSAFRFRWRAPYSMQLGRLGPVCRLEIDYMASLFLVMAIRWDVC